jgi:hypothetical protein
MPVIPSPSDVFRAFSTPGNPASGEHRPDKVDIVSMLAGRAGMLPTRQDLIDSPQPAEQEYVFCFGGVNIGDGLGGLFERRAIEGTSARRCQSADGAWWEHFPGWAGVDTIGSEEATNLTVEVAAGRDGYSSLLAKFQSLDATAGVQTHASAANLDIGTDKRRIVDITGSVDVTTLGTADVGVIRFVRSLGTFRFINSTSIVMPDGQNYRTQTNDLFVFYSLGANRWQAICVSPTNTENPRDHGGTIASAATIDFAAALEARTFDVSGSTTVTLLGILPVGSWRRLRFTGAMTLTHSAALSLPGSANILTAIGDVASFLSLGSGNWVCFEYQRASGKPLVPLTDTDIVDFPTISAKRKARTAIRMAQVPILWLGDSQFQNGFNTNNADPQTFMNLTAQTESSVLPTLYPGFDSDVWHDFAFNAQSWVNGSNAGRSSGQAGGGAWGTVTFTALPADGNTVTIAGRTYTFRTAPSAADSVLIGATTALTAANFAAAINRTGVAGITYGETTGANTSVGAERDGSAVVLVALAAGTGGNSITLARVGANITVSGATFAGGIANVALSGEDWLASYEKKRFHVAVVNLGVNDIWLANKPVAAIIFHLRRIVQRLRRAGVHVILGCPRPVAAVVGVDAVAWAVPSTNRTALINLRSRIIDLVNEFSNLGGVEFWDTWETLGTTGSAAKDLAISGYTYDGLHLSTLGSYHSSVWLWENHLKRFAPNIDSTPDWRFENFLPGHQFATTFVHGVTRVSGQAPTGFTPAWEASSDTNMFAALSYTNSNEGFQDLQILLAPSGGGAESGFILQQYNIPIPSFPVGKWVRGMVEVDMSNWNAWIGINVAIEHRNGGTITSAQCGRPYINGTTQAGTPDAWPAVPVKKILMTAPFIMPAVGTSLSWFMTVWARGDLGGSGTVQVRKRAFLVCEDPTKYWS